MVKEDCPRLKKSQCKSPRQEHSLVCLRRGAVSETVNGEGGRGEEVETVGDEVRKRTEVQSMWGPKDYCKDFGHCRALSRDIM